MNINDALAGIIAELAQVKVRLDKLDAKPAKAVPKKVTKAAGDEA